jgi:hypothetical protein
MSGPSEIFYLLYRPDFEFASPCGMKPMPQTKLARNNSYDGVQEFWITIRETGERTTELSYEEIHKNNTKAPCS